MNSSFSQRIWIITILLLSLASCSYSQTTKNTVCITKTGSKYHKCSCHYLKYSSFEISVSEAEERGYTPCSVCRPSAERASGSDKTPPGRATPSTRQQSSEQIAVPSRQCTAITKAGTRCKRTTTNANGKCWQHQ